ncbi:head GIN domain-containing protein [Mesonia aquimarina]|uniref:head GIN domain-containing protein n=1 Tax=Mesonia aquimarina TaxID=1504967 RepID=UPI000EF584F9|nr:head GIN domain-containing protein [Mesonia aquimarina]
MLTTLVKIVVTTAISLLIFSCNVSFTNGVKGEGQVTTKEILIEKPFSKIVAKKGWDVVLEKSSTPKITVKSHQNLIDIFDYKIENNTLTVSSKKNIGSAEKKQIIINYSETLSSIKTSSGTELTANNIIEQEQVELIASSGSEILLELKTASATIETSSGAEINLSGTVINCSGSASSGSEIEAKKLRTKTANLSASSGADIEMSVENKITASTSSGGSIDYYGNPSSENVKESTSGGNITNK